MSGGPSRRRFALPGRRRPTAGQEGADAPAGQWRAARLTALVTGLATLSHDLRGVLSPALLAAERLQGHADPVVRRSGDVLVRAVDRAMALLRDQLGPLRQGLPTVVRQAVELSAAIKAAVPAELQVQHSLPDALAVTADPALLQQACASLFAHALAQNAKRAIVGSQVAGRTVLLDIEHDGRPTRSGTQPPLGQPGGDWHLAIAQELLRACDGDLAITDGRLVASLRLA